MTNPVTKLGVVFVLVGTVAMLAPVFGITSITADRAVQVNAAETPATAYLGINETDSKEAISRTCIGPNICWGESAEVISLENNVGSSFDDVTVKVESVTGADDSILKVANAGELTGLSPDDPPQSVELECGSGGDSATDTEVTLVVDASGSSVSVSEATYTADGVSFDCVDDGNSGDGPATDNPIPSTDPSIDLELVDGSAETRASSGWGGQTDSRVQFEIANEGSEVTITGISLSEAGTAAHLRNRADNEVQITGGVSDGNLNRDGRVVIGPEAQRYDLDTQATIGAGDTVVVQLGQFREESTFDIGNQHDMNGKTVTLVLYTDLEHPDYQGETPVEITFSLPDE